VQDHIAALKAVYAEWGKGNFWTPEIFAPDVEIVWAAEMPDQATARGLSELDSETRNWLAPWENMRWTADEYIPLEDGVLVLFTARGRGKGSNVEVEAQWAHLWRFRGDKAIRVEGFRDQAEGRKAAGLTPNAQRPTPKN
jgi:ketosteroid isomerase-like protein